jgi:hypothetical protein
MESVILHYVLPMQILDCDHNTDCRLLSLDHRTWYKIYLENELDFLVS